MKTTHCIFYTHDNKDHKLPGYSVETSGLCIDAYDGDGNHLRCAEVIANGYCHKKRKTPVL